MNEVVQVVVEDDDQVQGLVEDTLTEAGFEPAVAPSGEEAVTLLKGQRGKYRALVTDITLRGKINNRRPSGAFRARPTGGIEATRWAAKNNAPAGCAARPSCALSGFGETAPHKPGDMDTPLCPSIGHFFFVVVPIIDPSEWFKQRSMTSLRMPILAQPVSNERRKS